LSRTCPGQIFSFAKLPPKTLNPSNFLSQTKKPEDTSRTKIFFGKKVQFITREFRVFFFGPDNYRTNFSRILPGQTIPGQKTTSPSFEDFSFFKG